MATTEKGVYYQDDYTKIADILADMKKMAESIDKLIEETEYDDKDVKNDIKTIQDEQKVQNKDIENIQTKDTEQDKLIQKLQANMIQESTEEATSLHVEDASNLPAVLSVRGNHYQETQEGTNNLAVLNEGSITQNGITINVENGVVNISGIATADTIIIIGEAYLYAGKTYYLSKDMYGGGYFIRNSQNEQKWFYDDETSVVMKNTGKCDVCVSFAANDTANKAVKLLISETSNANWVQGKKNIPSLEYSSEIETVKDNIKIIQCNSNFLKKQEETEITGQGLTGTVSNDGTITLNGTTTGATYIQLTDELKITTYTNSQNFEKHTLPNGSYKFISETSGQVSTNDIHAYIYGSSSATRPYIQRISESPKKEITFEVTNNENYYAYVWIKRGTTLTNFTMKFMLKRADDNSDYVQNEQKEYNLAVQQEMLKNDKFNLLSNKEMQTWKKTVLTGAENWQQSSVYNDVFYLVINDMMSDINKAQLISNQYKYEGYITDTADMQNNKCYTYKQYAVTNNKAVYVKNNNYTTLESFKAALAEKNMTLYYVTSTEIELNLTEEQKQVLNQLNNLELFKGVNNIYTEQDLALLQLDYTVDTKMYIDNKITSQNREG